MKLAAAFALAATLAAPPTDELALTATSINVAEPGTPVKIKILRWSTDDERAPLLSALNPPARGVAGEGSRNPNPPATAGLPAGAGRNPAPAAAAGAAGRGRGRGRGAPAAALSPIAAFTAVIGRAPTIGYIWTTDVTGYAIKYAWHSPLPDGGERIILATDRRLGAYSPAWALPAGAAPTDYEFTLIELRMGAKGAGEGKASLTAKVVVDGEAKTIALENYGSAPAILQNVRR